MSMHPIVSRAQYEAFEDPPSWRTELIDGELVLSHSPTRRHQKMVARLVMIFLPAMGPRYVALFGIDVEIGHDTTVRPDVSIITEEEYERDGPMMRPPLAVFEVHSPSNRPEHIARKKRLYLDHGIKYYFDVDVNSAGAVVIDKYVWTSKIYVHFTRVVGEDVLGTDLGGAIPPIRFRPNELLR